MTSSDRESMRRIYGSTIIIGGATLAAILVGVARSKVLALWVGPAGIGLIGVLNSIVTFAATLMALGLARSGVHRIATLPENRNAVIRSLMLATWLLAAGAALSVWLLREPISLLVTDSRDYSTAIGVSSLGVALLMVSGSQQAILQGLRHVSRLAQARVGGAVVGSLLALVAVYYFGTIGLALVVVAIPLGDALVTRYFLPRLEAGTRPDWPVLRQHWSAMLRFGLITMVAAVMTSSTQVLVRASLVDDAGLTGAGLYQAAYSISVMNIALVLTALAADFFPALSAIIDDRNAANRLVNQQFHAGLLMATPLILCIASASPYVLSLLYSSAFEDAALVMQLHTVGDLFKLLSWTLGAVLLAKKDLKAYLAVEAAFTAIYAGGTAVLVDRFGIDAAGIAYCLAYMVHCTLLAWRCSHRHGLSITGKNLAHFGLVAAAQFALLALVLDGRPVLWVGLGLTAIMAVVALVGMARATGWHNMFATMIRSRIGS